MLHVPKLFVSLVSVQKLAGLKNYNILFDDLDAYLCSKVHGSRIGLAKVKKGIYYLPGFDSRSSMKSCWKVASATLVQPILDLHHQMGHPSFHLLKQMYPHMFKDIQFESLICDACQLGKFKRSTYPSSNNRTKRAFQVLHCDVWGPSPHLDLLGHQFFLICTDDYSRFTWLFLLKHKSEVTDCIKNLCKLIPTQFGVPVQGLRTDNAKDFLNNNLSSFLASVGIRHETSCPYTPQQNGLAERKIGDIVDKAQTLLIHAHTPMNLWGFAIMTAAHLINRLPSQTLGFLSPIKLLETQYPHVRLTTDLPYKPFGCVAYVRNPTHKQNKWSHKALKGVFLGYSITQKGYKVYHPITKKYMVSKDVVFDEKTYYYNSNNNLPRNLPYLQLLDTSVPNFCPPEPTNDQNSSDLSPFTHPSPYPDLSLSDGISPAPDCSSVPTHIESVTLANPEDLPTDLLAEGSVPNKPSSDPLLLFPKFYKRRKQPSSTEVLPESQEPSHGETGLLQEGGVPSLTDESDVGWSIALRKGTRSCTKPKTFLLQNTETSITRTPYEALQSFHWKEAMQEERKALLQNNTWEIVDLPKGKTPVGCRWVFSLKCKSDGSLDRHKARLVAQGYTQTYGIDYQETFAPVAKLNTIRILISLAVNLDWPLRQYDIKNAFLHGDLKEEIYMSIPPRYGDSTIKGKVCKLKKALYGLKQSPRAWFGRFSQTMKALNFKQCNGEHTLFFKRSSEVLLTLLIVYVDDIVVTGNDLREIQGLERHLDQHFQVKRLGSLT